MKFKFLPVLLVTLWSIFQCSAPHLEREYLSNQPIMIRPFGDSITFGWGFAYYPSRSSKNGPNFPQELRTPPPLIGGGYRGWMTALAVRGQGIIFRTQGYQYGGSNIQQWTTSSVLHDGYPGWTNSNLMQIAQLPSYADVTLVHSGTNDVLQAMPALAANPGSLDQLASQAQQDLFTVINNLTKANKTGRFYVAQIIPIVAKNALDGLANELIGKYNRLVAEKWINLTPDVRGRTNLVDMQNILNPQSDYFDGVHPNCMGYLKMACTWIRAIQAKPAPDQIYTPPANPCAGMPVYPARDCKLTSNDKLHRLIPTGDLLKKMSRGR